MTTFTLGDVRRIMRQCAGESEVADLDGEIHDILFEDLGYDSLAVLEMAARVQQEYGVPMPDEAVDEMKTPGEAVEYINKRIATAV
ncbi:acyl carrier protein [Rhizohabitans arisaemae]|uniref:acyl carrier protein n=1 Tax=Rhizohabitans arisaemae TaxID=2720610 RepID=UPI0024B1D0E7|nr:phosphopantetheine-binding protein [Rhizohabitans arisaemae]